MRSPDNSAAIREQAKARKMSEQQFRTQMEFMKKQAEMAGSFEVPKVVPASPPNSASPDVFQAGVEERMKAGRRFGYAKTVMAGAQPRTTPALGGATKMGGYAA